VSELVEAVYVVLEEACGGIAIPGQDAVAYGEVWAVGTWWQGSALR